MTTMPDDLARYLKAFRTLHVNRTGDRASPHKPCMLLAVPGLAEAGDLGQNRIRFDPALLARYMKFFAAVRDASEHANPHYPFFHLKTEGLWHLELLPGPDKRTPGESQARLTALAN